jgi:peptidoglycan-N-acetylglucosamine deacetylase
MKILTFDIEDWFHVLDNAETATPNDWLKFSPRIEAGVDRILHLLDDTGQSATFFCLGWVAQKYPDVIKNIVREGHHLATHSYEHQLAYKQTRGMFEEDLRRSIETLEEISGNKIDTYRAPGFSITDSNLWAFEILGKFGIKTDCSVFPAGRAHGGLPKYSYAEPSIIKYNDFIFRSFPINTAKIFGRDIVYSGGGYFRLLPEWYINRRFSIDNYVMTYFHPRDFDPDQPIIPGLSFLRRFKSYVGLNTSFQKLENLLRTHNFMNVELALRTVDWSSVGTVDLGD